MALRRCPRVENLSQLPGDIPLDPIQVSLVTTIVDNVTETEHVSSPHDITIHPLHTTSVCKRHMEPFVYQHYLSTLPLLSHSASSYYTHPPVSSPLLSPRSDYGSEFDMEEDEAIGVVDAQPYGDTRGQTYPDKNFLIRQMVITDASEKHLDEDQPIGILIKPGDRVMCYLNTSSLTIN